MPTFDIDAERINVFDVGGEYLFSHYFEREDLFREFREYYDEGAYRFEVPEDEFEAVRERLTEEYFEPVVIEDLEDFCVLKEKYTEHADILRNAVAHWERRGHLFFLMEDELAVAEAIEAGATPIAETEFVLGI